MTSTEKTVLVVAAHPDDEILGCGGTIAYHARRKEAVHVVILGEGVTSRDDHRDRDANSEKLSTLGEAAQRAGAILGVRSTTLHGFPDNRMDSIDLLDMVKIVEGFIERFRPDIVYTHHRGDLNIDHRLVHDAVVTACRPLPRNHQVTTLLFFEVASSTEWQPPGSGVPFQPNWFVDITDTLELKLAALKEYSSEMCPWPHARSLEAVEHLAHWRGTSIGVAAAEAFMLGRNMML
ncbi:MAG: PIG-L family deacetylase [candidate division Zixibacteria bacterium]|nr:PIG-L family deacetylase [candidate division Zixibacteria bacterium]